MDHNPVTANEIKFVKSLGDKKSRDESGLFVVEGEKLVAEALASRFDVERVFRSDEIGQKAMSRMTQLSSPSPALAIVRKPKDLNISDINSYSLPSKGLFLALDGIRDPGNLGTILRIADWFGIDGIFASFDTVDIFNPKVVQSTMGAIFRVGFHYCSIPELCRKIRTAGGRVNGTFLEGENIYAANLDCGESGVSVIVTGNESRGISHETANEVTDRLFIPPWPADERGSESLNAAVATALAVSEFRRRQHQSHNDLAK